MAITKVWLDESDNGCNVCSACESVVDPVYAAREPKPPLGVMPRWLWLEQRYNDIHAAILRYQTAGFDVPVKWREERRELAVELQRERERENLRPVELSHHAAS